VLFLSSPSGMSSVTRRQSLDVLNQLNRFSSGKWAILIASRIVLLTGIRMRPAGEERTFQR
jgi:hypothetical protein